MNLLYAFLVVASLPVLLVSPVGFIFERWRQKAKYAFGISLVVFVVALTMYTPEKKGGPAVAQQPSTVPAASPQVAPSPPIQAEPAQAAAATPAAPSEPVHAGTARVCVTDDELHFKEIDLPATTVLKDAGEFSGDRNNPSTWRYGKSDLWAAIVTADPIVLTKAKHCADVTVKMLIAPLAKATSAKVSDARIYQIDDVLDFPIPKKRPDIEIGKLIDDISVRAILLADVNDAIAAPPMLTDEQARADLCLSEAKKFAAHMNAAVGRQTNSVVFIGNVPAGETTYGCPFGPKNAADLNISWDGRAKPKPETADFIGRAGEFLTGAPAAEVKQELAACVSEALKPASNELADREFKGVKIECQAFARDGGGGSATIYRRFGTAPARSEPTEAELSALQRSSEALKAEEENRGAGAVAFAQWWSDPSIPKEVKVFAMTSGRILALAQRCPSRKANYRRIAEDAARAGVEPADINPGGKYYPLLVEMTAAMVAGTATESVQSACETARKYD